MLTETVSTPRPSAARVAAPLAPVRREWIWLVICAMFTAAIIQYSLKFGRLAAPPGFDDLTYFVDGLERLRELRNHGLAGLAHNILRDPPHSYFSTALALTAYVTLGTGEWTPYVLNGSIILGLAGVVNLFGRGLSLWRRIALFIFVLTIPISSRAVSEFRPDIASAICAAAGAVLLLTRPLVGRRRAELALVGAFFGLAMFIKTPTFPLTLMMCCASLAIVAAEDWLLADPKPPIRSIARNALTVGIATFLFALPAYVLDPGNIVRYIYAPVFGNSKEVWRTPGPLSFQLRFYIDGESGSTMLGQYLYLLLAIILLGIAAAAIFRNRVLIVRVIGLLIVAAVAYAIPTAMAAKQPFFGTSFDMMLVLTAVYLLVWMCRHVNRVVSGAALGLVVAAAVWMWRFPPPMYPIAPASSADAIARRRAVNSVFQALFDLHLHAHAPVYVTTTGTINADLMNFMFLQRGLAELNFDQRPASGDVAEHVRQMEHCQAVIASESGNTEAMSWFASGKIQDQTLAAVRNNSQFEQVAEVPTLNGKRYFVFRRAPAQNH